MKLILIGFMGSGKSSVAAKLSENLNIKLIELDHLIINFSGYESINEIFENSGEETFRELETKALKEALSSEGPFILSSGGGVIENQVNQDLIKNTEQIKIVYLQTSFEEIQKRLADDQERPLFKDGKAARQLYQKRLDLYSQLADLVIDTDSKSIEEVCEAILEDGSKS